MKYYLTFFTNIEPILYKSCMLQILQYFIVQQATDANNVQIHFFLFFQPTLWDIDDPQHF